MRLWPAGPEQVQMAKASAYCQLPTCWIIVMGLQETSWPATPHTSLRTLSTRSHSAFTLALAQRLGHSSWLFSSYGRVICFRLQSLQPSYALPAFRPCALTALRALHWSRFHFCALTALSFCALTALCHSCALTALAPSCALQRFLGLLADVRVEKPSLPAGP